MRKRRGRLKRIVSASVALAVALLVAGYAIVSSLDVQRVADFARGQVKDVTGRELTIDGAVQLRISLSPSVDLEDVRFANAAWGSRADMVRLRRLEIEVGLLPLLFGDVVVKRLVVIEPDILLETDAEGRGNWEFDDAGAAAPARPAAAAEEDGAITLPDVRDIHIDGGRLTMTDAERGQVLRLDIVEAVGLVPAGGGTRSLRLAAAYNGHPFSLDARYAGLPSLLSGAPGPLDLTLEAGGATVTVQGTAGDLTGVARADVALTAAGDSLAGLSPFVGDALPALGPYKISASMKAEAQAIELSSLAILLGGSDLTGNAALALAGERPSLKANLVAKRLDLADFRDGSSGAAAQPAAVDGGDGGNRGDGRLFPDEALPLAALRALDAQVRLGADELRLSPGLALDEVQLTLSLKGGDLTVDPFAARLAGGALDGRLALAGSDPEPQMAFALKGTQIDFGDLLKQAEVSDEVGGEMALDIDLKGRGTSPHALAAGLGGHVQAVAEEGTVDNTLLSALSAGVSNITGPLFGAAERTRLECLVAHFDIDQGQARSRALVIDTGAFAIAGRGGIDLEAERVNLAFDTQTSQPSLASLAVPFKVIGPLADPSVVPDPVAAARGLAGTVGDVAESGGRVVGGAVDAVGGLVGTGPLIGPVGGSQSLCGEALAAIGRGGPGDAVAPQSDPAAPRSSSGGLVDDVGNALEDAGDSVERGLKNLFGN